MTKSAHPERETQNRIIKFFQKELGYKYLGNLEDSENYNVRWGDWKTYLTDNGYSDAFIESLQNEFNKILADFSQSPYHTNKEVYRILKYGLKHPNPEESVLKRYRELGGERITIGSDAHQPEHIAYDFAKAEAILKELGFQSYCIFHGRKPNIIPL